MPRSVPPLSAALTHLRVARGWTQQELALAAGKRRQVICAYESGGQRQVSREKVVELVALMGWGEDDVTLALLFGEALSATVPAPDIAESPVEPSPAEARSARRLALRVGLAEASERRSQMLDLARDRRAEKARLAAAGFWDRLRGLAVAEQRETIEASPELHSWALAERLCEESERAAANDEAVALHRAWLALRVAELVPGSDPWRSRLQGYCQAFVANAQRVSGDLTAAEASMTAAWGLWRGVESVPPDLLGEWRLHDLEASLRRDQRQFPLALVSLDLALAAAPAAVRGRVLLKKQYTLEQAGEIEASLAVLEEAAPILESAPERRLLWILEMNRIVMLCHLGRHGEAEARLQGLQRLTNELGNRLDLARVLWLTGRVAAGQGRRGDARAAFERAGRVFAVHRIGIDAALISLELAIVHLEEGRVGEVVRLAEEMLTVFGIQRVHREALAALRLFCEAARAGGASVGLARHVINYLEAARRNPQLRFVAPQ
jgi:tetratricopeptide (TPR) repeat protein/DNA-binding XRE family transcriptional regulator